VIRHSQDGSIHFIFSDWKDLPELLSAARPIYTEWKTLLVWSKRNAGRGTFYHPAHELIAAFKSGSAAHIQNFGAGDKGRYRTNLLDYPRQVAMLAAADTIGKAIQRQNPLRSLRTSSAIAAGATVSSLIRLGKPERPFWRPREPTGGPVSSSATRYWSIWPFAAGSK